jgi:hypothetical protein
MLKPFVAGVAVAGAVVAAGWFVRVAPEREGLLARVADAEEAARRASREASDREIEAHAERERNRELELRVQELERTLVAAPPLRSPGTGTEGGGDPGSGGAGGGAARGGHGGGHGGGSMGRPGPSEADDPAFWTRDRLNQEFEHMAASGAAVPKHPRIPLAVKALRKDPEMAFDLLSQIVRSDLDGPFIVLATILGAEIGEERLVPVYFERWQKEPDAELRYALFRALSKLPGEQITPALLQTAFDGTARLLARQTAIEGLALRGANAALDCALGKGIGEGHPELRIYAVRGLRTRAERSGFKEDVLVPIFGQILRTADGPNQAKLALLGLEGAWTKAAAEELDTYASNPASDPALASRARKSSEAILAGKPRPERAGLPEVGLREDD